MKRLAIGLLVFVNALFCTSSLYATHIRGGEITATQISPSEVQITITGYRDRSSAEFGAGVLNFGDGTQRDLGVEDWSKWNLNGQTEINVFIVVHSYSSAGAYTIGYQEANRNAGILNINNGGSVDIPFYTEAEIIIPEQVDKRFTSPVFISPVVFRAIKGEEFTFNAGAYDPDAEGTLQYSLVPCMQSRATVVPDYEFPDAIAIDRHSGLITWIPSKAGEYSFAVRVTKYLEGVYDGYVIRDFQIIVEESSIHQQITLLNPEEISFIDLAKNTILVPPGDSVVLEVKFASVASEHLSLQAFSELLLDPTPLADFQLREENDGKLGTFKFTPDASLLRPSPYLVTFRGTSSSGSGEEFSKELSFLLYTQMPEEGGIISHVSSGAEEGLVVYPNPAQNFLKFKNSKGDETVEMYSLMGDLLSKRHMANGLELSLGELKAGAYFFKVWRKNELIKSGKLLVQ